MDIWRPKKISFWMQNLRYLDQNLWLYGLYFYTPSPLQVDENACEVSLANLADIYWKAGEMGSNWVSQRMQGIHLIHSEAKLLPSDTIKYTLLSAYGRKEWF
jgi:hypothetical protein